jgi:histidinol-phosphate/aromatic aminotransferase/cobyric acid decarboxylase-like protein/adenosyl cobinamide kinase/adenosyl cobinamide phosphate guanylyltransferase
MSLVLVTGGTRSGKSAVAERLLEGEAVAYLATASPTDAEMAERISRHRSRRPASWSTIEVGADLAAAVAAAADRPVLLDGLGGWIASALHHAGAFAGGDLDAAASDIRARVADLVTIAQARTAPTVVVVEQAGSAPVAADAATRRWVDLVGEAAQRLAAVADRALLVVAGRTVELSAERPALCPPARPLHGDRLVPAGHEDFAVNVVAGGPPSWVREALRRALDQDAARYPDERAAAAALARRHGRPALCLNGAAEGFWLLAATLRPRRAVVVAPAFTEAATALSAHGIAVEHARRGPDFAASPVPGDADFVVLANPCNPTGTLHPREAVLALRRPGRTLVVDEAFMDLVAGEAESVAGEPGVVVLRSLTKSLAIPGIRAGYLLADEDLVDRLGRHRQPWSVNALALAALTAFAEHPDPAGPIAREIAGCRARLVEQLERAGITTYPAAANFVLVRVEDGPRVLAGLRAHAIAVRPTTDLGLDGHHFRVAVRDDAANARLVAALAGLTRPLENVS